MFHRRGAETQRFYVGAALAANSSKSNIQSSGFALLGELLFFQQRKKSNQKNAAHGQFALRVPSAFDFANGPP
jgi:hypothetical protein